MNQIHRAILSVTDKTNIVELAKFLTKQGIEIVSTGGTAELLKKNDIKYIPIEDLTGMPESFDGRMKSISFQLSSGILFDRDLKTHQIQRKELEIKEIDLVVCNLYPFEKKLAEKADYNTLIENIDIGGPNMIRAAAKNHKSVTVLTQVNQYQTFYENFDLESKSLNQSIKKELALQAFELTAKYDKFIYQGLSQSKPEELCYKDTRILRYGENPHQKSSFVKIDNTNNQSLFDAKQLNGKELSHNNILDMDAAWRSSYDSIALQPEQYQSVSIVKHCNPCGLAISSSQEKALEFAWKGDPISAFGSIISFTEELELASAEFLSDKFIEVIMAPSFNEQALNLLKIKKNLRIIEVQKKKEISVETTYKSVSGGLLISEEDNQADTEFQAVTKNKLETKDFSLAKFGTNVCKHLKSNGICLVSNTDSTMWLSGSGMGQPNRLEALKNLSIPRFKSKSQCNMDNSILISDAFFPFKDSIELANEFGIKKIVQPGGSIRDSEIIETCDLNNIKMSFTGRRHFRH